MAERGVVAAGHPLTAAAGADVLRAGGNAVDAALAALMMSFMTEPLLTGLGAGGYMLVAPPGGAPVLLDFMVEAPGRGASPASRAPLDAVVIDFGDAVQVFHIGASSCGVYGTPAGIAAAAERFGTVPLERVGRAGDRARPRRASRSTRRRPTCGNCWARSRSRRAESCDRYCVDGRRAARRRDRARSRPRRRHRAARHRRRRAVLYRRHRHGGLGLGDEPRRHAHATST